MPPNDKKSSADNEHDIEDQNLHSTNARNQIFLKALQDLIVRVVDPKRINDIDQISLGPEAEKLITALHEFVASIAGQSEPMSHGTVVEVSLVEENTEPKNKHDDIGMGRTSLPITVSAKSYEGAVRDTDSHLNLRRLDFLEDPQLMFQKNLLKGLREHIFNTMPIRMLSFEPHGSSLQITLLERGAVYSRLERVVRRKIEEKYHIALASTETEATVIKQLVSKYARYAILSHTWLQTSPEITYSNWTKGSFNTEDPGYHKLVNFCKIAWRDHGLTLGWMDTVCINKESSSELDESIRSMYNWYHRAEVCIIYLAETEIISNIHMDRWFTRGWTLQELLAPNFIKFYNNDWERFTKDSLIDDDKDNAKIREEIRQATTISEYELKHVGRISISRRMQLAATREVTREEDMAYSLMGIFNVSISTAYGEGAERAFFRLLREILASSVFVLDALNWAGDLPTSRSHSSRILPPSPLPYLKSAPYILGTSWPLEPLTLTHLGLRLPVIMMSAIFIPDKASRYVPLGDYSAVVDLSPAEKPWHHAPSGTYYLLQTPVVGRDGIMDNGSYKLTLAVFNISGDAPAILIYHRCFAKVLYFETDISKAISSGDISVIHTHEPIVFELSGPTTERSGPEDFRHNYYTINQDQLAKHGMQLVSLYL